MNSTHIIGTLPDHGGPVRISPTDVRSRKNRCPRHWATKARPATPRPYRSAAPSRTLTTWASGPLHDVLDLVEFSGLSVEDALTKWRSAPGRPFHPALGRWTEHAVHGYLSACATIPTPPGVPSGEPPAPVSRLWARQRGPSKPGDPQVYEEMVTDRRYAGQGVRELRIVRTGSVHDRPRDEAEIAVAAGVLAGGSPVLSSRWSKSPFRLGAYEPARLVRLVEIGCVDASHRVLFEGTPDEAYALYDSAVEARIAEVITDGSYRPGQDCGRCPTVAECPAVPSRPGLLGISGSELPRRSWSMTTGRAHRSCPARAHMADLFLPRENSSEDTAATVRGRAVHAWIESRHRRVPPQACTPDDTPGRPDAWQYEGLAVSGFEARLGLQMIGDHSLVCPLRGPSDDIEVHPEQPVVVYDPDADVVVIAKTDLLYRSADRWTVRETKTARTAGEADPLERHPQLALAVLLARAQVLPGAGRFRVELERLTASGSVMSELDVTAADVATRAQRVLETYVAPWHTDTRYPTRAGEACADCPFTRWCPDAVERTGA
ncbi:PD-(D/E)XK nuclease family protein [Kitasatospora sp. SC0581]|uniref:PD-(D/E)XK nuclease family protein n=1 Tax=Kitasatospora sp. SC0581 TaxID=3394360 RepID=UPI003A8A945B